MNLDLRSVAERNHLTVRVRIHRSGDADTGSCDAETGSCDAADAGGRGLVRRIVEVEGIRVREARLVEPGGEVERRGEWRHIWGEGKR